MRKKLPGGTKSKFGKEPVVEGRIRELSLEEELKVRGSLVTEFTG